MPTHPAEQQRLYLLAVASREAHRRKFLETHILRAKAKEKELIGQLAHLNLRLKELEKCASDLETTQTELQDVRLQIEHNEGTFKTFKEEANFLKDDNFTLRKQLDENRETYQGTIRRLEEEINDNFKLKLEAAEHSFQTAEAACLEHENTIKKERDASRLKLGEKDEYIQSLETKIECLQDDNLTAIFSKVNENKVDPAEYESSLMRLSDRESQVYQYIAAQQSKKIRNWCCQTDTKTDNMDQCTNTARIRLIDKATNSGVHMPCTATQTIRDSHRNVVKRLPLKTHLAAGTDTYEEKSVSHKSRNNDKKTRRTRQLSSGERDNKFINENGINSLESELYECQTDPANTHSNTNNATEFNDTGDLTSPYIVKILNKHTQQLNKGSRKADYYHGKCIDYEQIEVSNIDDSVALGHVTQIAKESTKSATKIKYENRTCASEHECQTKSNRSTNVVRAHVETKLTTTDSDATGNVLITIKRGKRREEIHLPVNNVNTSDEAKMDHTDATTKESKDVKSQTKEATLQTRRLGLKRKRSPPNTSIVRRSSRIRQLTR